MPYQKEIRKVYYHVLEGSRYIFADERNKKKLLDIVLDVQIEEGWMNYAFCVMDDRAYFVTEAAGRRAVHRGVQKMECRFLDIWREYAPNLWCNAPVLREGVIEELSSLPEIAVRCRQIHRLPLDGGYVSRIEDYWWSSYITYTGIYEWGMVDCRSLSLYFSADQETARKKLKCYHQ